MASYTMAMVQGYFVLAMVSTKYPLATKWPLILLRVLSPKNGTSLESGY